MARLREVSRQILEDARDAIAWIALYKAGRGWAAECFWPDQDGDGNFVFEKDDEADIVRILAADKNAIFVNGYYCNLGPLEEMTLGTLMSALRWQYDEQFFRLADAFTTISQEAQPEPERASKALAGMSGDKRSMLETVVEFVLMGAAVATSPASPTFPPHGGPEGGPTPVACPVP